jgi:hypothetical protein
MASQADPGVLTLPGSLLDTDFYKARTSDTGDVSCLGAHRDNTAIIFANSSRCSRPCCITFPRPKQRTSSLTAMPTYTSPASVTSNSSRLYLVRTRPRFCFLFLSLDILEARVLHLIPDTRGTHLAAKHVPLFQAFVPRLPCRISLQAVPGPRILRSARTRQRRRPHRN